jgi:hypothetical protein
LPATTPEPSATAVWPHKLGPPAPTARWFEQGDGLAVLISATDEAGARSEAAELVALAHAAGLEVWCGYAALAAGWGAAELLGAAEAALAYARRLGPGTVIG